MHLGAFSERFGGVCAAPWALGQDRNVWDVSWNGLGRFGVDVFAIARESAAANEHSEQSERSDLADQDWKNMKLVDKDSLVRTRLQTILFVERASRSFI